MSTVNLLAKLRAKGGDRSRPAACSHLGREKKRIGLRMWRECNGGYGSTTPDERAGHVCKCSTPGPGVWRIGHECGPTCPGYASPAEQAAAPNPYPYILVPPNPYPVPGPRITIGDPPALTPNSDRLVCTVAVGEKGAAMLAATGPLMERHAAKVGADFHAITGPALNPGYPLGDKFRLHHLTPHYRRLLFVDADALIHPDAPDLFDEVPAGVAIRDDAPQVGDRSYLSAAYRHTLASQGEDGGDGGRVLNSGVVLWGRDTPDVWSPPARPLPAGVHVAEQCWTQRNVTTQDYPLTLLSRRWNYQWWTDRPLAGVDAARPWVLHMAGLSQMHQVPGWKMDADTVRQAVLIAAAWAASPIQKGV